MKKKYLVISFVSIFVLLNSTGICNQSVDMIDDDSVVVLVGLLDKNAMGGSAYLDCLNSAIRMDSTSSPRTAENVVSSVRPEPVEGFERCSSVPTINLEETTYVFNALHELIQQGEVLACHDIS